AIALALLLAIFCLSSTTLRTNRKMMATAVLVGLAIAFGWIVTGIWAQDVFNPYPLESFTFSAPLGEAIVYVMTMTGASLKFGIGAVAGVVFGAAATTLVQKHFRWEVCDDAREMRRQMLGGVLMGFGGVTAFGCTIGQGLTAASALAFSAPVALVGIYAGAWIGLHVLVHGSVWEPFKQLWSLGGKQ
ncbi:MAG: YeeE/YedE thiosulfate transporter family protein, partial [Hyphomicrobiales bacterium]